MREWRRCVIHANLQQGFPIAVLSLFNDLVDIARAPALDGPLGPCCRAGSGASAAFRKARAGGGANAKSAGVIVVFPANRTYDSTYSDSWEQKSRAAGRRSSSSPGARASAVAPMRSSSPASRGQAKDRRFFRGLAHPSGMPAARRASMMRSRCFKYIGLSLHVPARKRLMENFGLS
jgi:hypothetical protein